MDQAELLLGKVIVVGLSLYRHDGVFLRNIQVSGTIREIDAEAGVVFRDNDSGREFHLPPAFKHIHAAPPGKYRARDSDHVVEDPDFITQWAVRLPEGADESEIDWRGPMNWSADPLPDAVKRGLL